MEGEQRGVHDTFKTMTRKVATMIQFRQGILEKIIENVSNAHKILSRASSRKYKFLSYIGHIRVTTAAVITGHNYSYNIKLL